VSKLGTGAAKHKAHSLFQILMEEKGHKQTFKGALKAPLDPPKSHVAAPLAILGDWPSCRSRGSALCHRKPMGTQVTAQMRSARCNVSFSAL